MIARVEWRLKAEVELPDDVNVHDHMDVLRTVPSPYDFVHQDNMEPPDVSVAFVRLELEHYGIEYEYDECDGRI